MSIGMVEDTWTTKNPEEQREDDRLRTEQVKRRVLVVEDDPSNREALVDILQSWGYGVVAVQSAEEAEYVARRRRFDAALVDVYLPGRSGASLLTKLRGSHPDVVLIGMSGLSDAEMARTLKGVGADLFIGKPIQLEELAEALEAGRVSWH